MSNGRVDIELEQGVVDEVIDLIGQIEAKLPFLLRLDNAEKRRLVKPHPGALQVGQGIQQIQADVGITLGNPGDDALAADLSVYVGLTAIHDRWTDLAERIDDTRLQAGSEAWNESLIRYGILRQRQRAMPELEVRLDRLQPLITSRSTRSASGQAEEPAEDGEAGEPTEPTTA